MRWLLWCFCSLAESYETINHYHYHYHSRLLLVAQRAPITIGTTLALMFHILCISNLRSWYVSTFSLSFSTICVSFYIATSIMSPSSAACLLLICLVCELVSVCPFWTPSLTVRAYYGMKWNIEWKKKSVWNMEWLKYGMEDLMYGMEQIFQIPCKFHTCTFWRGVAKVRFFFRLNILANRGWVRLEQ